MKKYLFFLFTVGIFFTATSQNEFKWWEKKHQWDGISDYTKYMTYSPRYFGPNALPIPEVSKAEIEKKTVVEFSGFAHQTTGDNTYNLYNRLYLPVGNRIALEGFVNSLEHYALDTILRDQRAARDVNPKGLIGGDIYLVTHFLIIKETEKRPSFALRIGLRTAAGLHLKNARYTDAPGYYFDFSAGKNVVVNEKLKLRFYGMLGFYAWQTNLSNYQQNDAVLFGIGSTIDYKKWFSGLSFSGYEGYINNGDKPRSLNFNTGFKSDKFSISFEFREGFIDNLYTTAGLRFCYFLKPLEN